MTEAFTHETWRKKKRRHISGVHVYAESAVAAIASSSSHKEAQPEMEDFEL